MVWLLPIATLVAFENLEGIVGLIIAYLPLVLHMTKVVAKKILQKLVYIFQTITCSESVNYMIFLSQ